jgi:hypothetical protein
MQCDDFTGYRQQLSQFGPKPEPVRGCSPTYSSIPRLSPTGREICPCQCRSSNVSTSESDECLERNDFVTLRYGNTTNDGLFDGYYFADAFV